MSLPYATARILIVDDDEDDFILTGEYMQSIPGNSFKIEWCKNFNDALVRLKSAEYDIYFVDYRLGAKSGVDFLKEAIRYQSEEPIVLLTGKGNYDVDIEAMQLGAVDYLVKTELTTEKMERCIRYALERSNTLKALRANERKYRSIFEKSKDVVFIADHTLNFIDVNDAAKGLLGYEKNEIMGTDLIDLIEKEQHKLFITDLLTHNNELNDYEVVLNTKFGEK